MKFECPACKQKMEVESLYAGQRVQCPACGDEIVVPEGLAEPADVTLPSEPVEAAAPASKIQFNSAPKPTPATDVQLDAAEILDRSDGGKYELGQTIAKGGMGAIQAASDLNIRRSVAMKLLLDPKQASRQQMFRFIEEAQITGQLEHPGIVPVHDLGLDADGNVFYTMKLVRGKTLHDILKGIAREDAATLREYPIGRLLTIFQKICDAIAFAHAHNVIHRDLKPENVMIGEYGEVLVLDWGIAKVLDDTGNREAELAVQSARTDEGDVMATMVGSVFGTPMFMPPEQARGETANLNCSSDIYSLGAILYNILTLRPPVTGSTVMDVIRKVGDGEITAPTVYNTNPSAGSERAKPGSITIKRFAHLPDGKIPNALAAVAMKAMALQQEDRYSTVPELQSDIEAYQGGFATTAERAGLFRLLMLFIKRNKVATFAALIITVLGVAFVANNLAKAQAIAKVSREAAPEFVTKARNALSESRVEDARAAVNTAIGLHPESVGAWLEKARLDFDEHEFADALAALDKSQDYDTENQFNERIAQFREFTATWSEKIAAEGKGLLPAHMLAMAPELQPIDPILSGRLFARTGDQEAALKVLVVKAYEEMKAANPELRWKTDRNSDPDHPGFHWSHVFQEEGMRLRLNQHAVEAKKLINIETLSQLPLHTLEIDGTGVSDLSPLSEMRTLRVLKIGQTAVLNLEALRTLQLEELTMGSNPRIESLEPLRGMPLKVFAMDHCIGIADLSPLTGMPLESISLDGGLDKITSIEVLRGMPLRRANLDGLRELLSLEPIRGAPIEHLDIKQCSKITDISMLAGMPLKSLEIGTLLATDLGVLRGKELEILNVSMPLEDIGFLRHLTVRDLAFRNANKIPSLDHVRSQRNLTTLRVLGTQHERGKITDLSPLRGLPLRNVEFGNLPITDLTPLSGLNLATASLHLPEATDFRVLADMKELRSLKISGPVTDLSFLANKEGLTDLYLDGCTALTDIRIVSRIPNLQRLTLPKTATNINFLRDHPKLNRIGYGQYQEVTQFWTEQAQRR